VLRKVQFVVASLMVICALAVSMIIAPVAMAYTPYPLQTTDTEVANALNYLQGQQVADGSIGGFSNSAWVTMAIAAAGEDPDTWDAGGDSIVDYLAANAGTATSALDYARMILAITAAEQNPTNFGGIDFVTLLEAQYDGIQIGSATALNDDAWGIMALISAGASPGDAIITNSATFIKTNQNVDGGWGWALGQASDADSTSAPIMALIAAGEASSSTVIQNALAYIKSTQMDSGGFNSWGSTNADTDSWCIDAIVAANEDPTSAAWQSGLGNDPVDDLVSFQNPDGSFNWQIGNPGMAIEKTTASALQALLGVPYPVKVMTPSEVTINVRIEGETATVWSGDVTVTDSTIIDDLGGSHYLPIPTALGALDEASQAGGFPYTVKDFGWGLAITSIDGAGDWNAGPYWLYRVDGASASVGADAFELNVTTPPVPPHTEVLFYETSTFGEMPLNLELDKTTVAIDELFTATVTNYDDATATWIPLEGATVHADTDYTTGVGGTVDISVDHDATIDVYAEMSSYIRSDKVSVTVGDGGGSGGPSSEGMVSLGAFLIPAVAIEVTPSSLYFGELGPRDASDPIEVTITNQGAWDVLVTADVTDDAEDLFVEGLNLDGSIWSSYEVTILRNGLNNTDAVLTVPEYYTGTGAMEGTLIFWATEAP